MTIEQRDRIAGYVSLSCAEGACGRCLASRPKHQKRPTESLAPECMHKCHETGAATILGYIDGTVLMNPAPNPDLS